MNEGSSQGSCIHTCWHVDWHAWGFLSMFIIPMKGFYIYYSRHGCRINNDRFPKLSAEGKSFQPVRGVWGNTPAGDFLDFTVNSLKSSFLGFRVIQTGYWLYFNLEIFLLLKVYLLWKLVWICAHKTYKTYEWNGTVQSCLVRHTSKMALTYSQLNCWQSSCISSSFSLVTSSECNTYRQLWHFMCSREEIFQTTPKWGYGKNAKRKNKQTDLWTKTNKQSKRHANLTRK